MCNSKVVIVTYGGGHVNMLLPVIKALQKLPYCKVVVLGLTTAGSVLERHNIPYLGFKDLLHLTDDSALYYGHKLVGDASSSSLISFEESVAYMGINYRELVNRYGEDQAEKLYIENGRHSFYPIDVLKSFLFEQSPDLVLATNSPRAEKAVIHAAKNLNIPSVCLVDLFVFQSVKWIGESNYGTKVCVLSDYVKETLLKAGRLEHEVVVTGNPVFEKLAFLKKKVPLFMLNRRWNNAKKVILWASQVEPNIHPFNSSKKGDVLLPRKIEQVLFDFISDYPDWYLVIRPHPSDNFEYVDVPKNVEIGLKTESLHDLIASVDVVITMTSTVAVEAALVGKKVITIDRSIFTEDAPYSKMGFTEGVTNLEKLESVLCKPDQLDHSSIKEVIGEHTTATNSVVQVVKSLLG